MKQTNQHICPKCNNVIPDEAPGGLCPKCALEGVLTVTNITSGGRNAAPPSIGEITPHFPELEILELIGAGGMGAVYKARQPNLDRFVALKILSHDLAGDPAFVERFNREARVLGRLSHPNIVGIHDFGTAGPYCYLTMELVDGVNLRQAMRAGRFTPNEALAMVQHLCSALKFAHEEGILHRDIKPENILIDSKGRVKIADFGIAKLVGEDRQHDVTLTMQGSVLGSPHYMAPEQIETPGDVDQRADIYSLGVVLYEMLTGELPIGRFALPSEKTAMDARIDEIVLRTLAKERQARYQTAAEVSTGVEAVTKHPACPPTIAAPLPTETGTARFSMASAILTGSSIIFAIAFPSALEISSGWSTLAVLILVVIAVSAFTGFIFGACALGEIRKSGGNKDGAVRAIFGVTALPILLLLVFLHGSQMTPEPGTETSFESLVALLFLWVPMITGSWIFVRALWRWSVGVERKDGTRQHPGFGIPLLALVLLPIGSILLFNAIAQVIYGGGDRDNLTLMASDDRMATSGGNQPLTNSPQVPIDWRLGESELDLILSISPEIRVEFFLVMQDGQGNPLKYSRIGVWEGEKGSRPPKIFIVKIGTLGSQVEESDSEVSFAGYLDLTGESGEIHSVPDIEKWRLESFESISNLYDGETRYTMGLLNGTSSIRVGERHETIDGISKLTGILKLEVRATTIK